MNYEKITLKEGIVLHKLQTNKFKTDLIAVFLSMPLTRQDVTKNALLTAVLRRGCAPMPSQDIISKKLEEMYGASFDCGIEKTGDIHNMKFYLETINNNFLPEETDDNLKMGLESIFDIILNPLVENEQFKQEYVDGEKENLRQIIEGKINNKQAYALEKCIENMYKDKPFGLYKFGYIEDLENITSKELFEHYKKIISSCKIDIFVSGQLPENVQKLVEENENIKKLQKRKVFEIKDEIKEKVEKENIINESMNVTQGKLVMGMDVISDVQDLNYIAMVYNTILGSGANSKLFQNVREKESLAYTCGSNYLKRKQIVLIRAGIEIKNYEKAVRLIKKEVEDMEKGNFTKEDMEKAKILILSTIDNISEEQDTEITYYFGQELIGQEVSLEEYKEKIKNVTGEQVIDLANNIYFNTIYFLKD